MMPMRAVVMVYFTAFSFSAKPSSLTLCVKLYRPSTFKPSAGRVRQLSAADADGAKLPFLFDEAAERRLRVVVEEAEPALARGLREQSLLGFERLDRVEVVAHDPRRGQVRARRHEVGEAVERAPPAFEPQALHRARV